MDAVKIVNKISEEHGTIKNVYFLACGGSLVDLYPGYYFLRAESAVMDAQWIPAREFALTPPKKLGKDSLLVICSHSGKTKECLLDAPPKSLAMASGAPALPYTLYNLRVSADGFLDNIHLNIPVFSGITSVQKSDMLPNAVAGGRTDPVIFNEFSSFEL